MRKIIERSNDGPLAAVTHQRHASDCCITERVVGGVEIQASSGVATRQAIVVADAVADRVIGCRVDVARAKLADQEARPGVLETKTVPVGSFRNKWVSS